MTGRWPADNRFAFGSILLGILLGAAAASLVFFSFGGRPVQGLPPGTPRSWLPVLLGLLLAALLLASVVTLRRWRAQVDRLSEAARQWSAGKLDHRLEPARGAALSHLTGALEEMAASLAKRDELARRHAEEQIIQAEKLATTGRLAAGVAHEINNPLGGILLCADLLLETTEEKDPRRENMQRIAEEATRAREIVRGLLDFARQSRAEITRTNLNQVASEVLGLLDRQPLFQRVQIRSELCPAPLWVRLDRIKMQQVFINIIMNALEAMRDGGTLILRSGFSEQPGFCRVAITDTGYGISAENLNKIFEPFFTTKEVGQGLGLGLAIAYGIVQQHGGEIEVQSAVGAGSTFRVLLPLAPEE
jgi:signal transduction histidine kinase